MLKFKKLFSGWILFFEIEKFFEKKNICLDVKFDSKTYFINDILSISSKKLNILASILPNLDFVYDYSLPLGDVHCTEQCTGWSKKMYPI